MISTEVKQAEIQVFSYHKKNSEIISSVIHLYAIQKDDQSSCLPLNLT